jgi:pimeloyl-ACP methyl ester carboxylesterase
MRRKSLVFACSVIFVLSFICGCSKQTEIPEPENVVISSDGVEVYYDVQGTGSPALVFVHGWSNNRTIWDLQMSHFSNKHKVVALDLAGFGESGNNRKAWTIDLFAEDVVSVINKVNPDKVVMVGFSMGAPVVIETANMLPNRVAGVVLVDFLQDVSIKYPPEMISQVENVFMDMAADPTLEKMVGGGFIKKNPEESYQKILSMLGDGPGAGWRESLNNTLQWQNEQCAKSLEKLEVPVRAINSENQPTNVEAFQKYVPSFQVKIIPDAGHVLMWDATEEFNSLLEENIQEFVNRK